MRVACSACVSLCWFCWAVSAGAETYVVLPDGTGDFPTIQAAINSVAPGDVIELGDGTFVGPGNRDVAFLGREVTVRSQSGNPEACTVDCGGSFADPHRGFMWVASEGPATVLERITITNGHTCDSGGVDDGGGLLIIGNACPTIRGCVLSHNLGDRGGGAHCGEQTAPTFESCLFLDNGAGCLPGGGAGGAVSCDGESSPTFLDCSFYSNGSNRAGAVMIGTSGTVTFDHCTYADNGGFLLGGAVLAESGTSVFTSCTFVGNGTEIAGAQIQLRGDHAASFDHTIVAFAQDEISIALEAGSSANLECCDLFGNGGGDWVGPLAPLLGVQGNISLDPLFCDAPDLDFTLHADSPCAPASPPNPECGQIGAWPVGCGGTPSRETTWGALKVLFR